MSRARLWGGFWRGHEGGLGRAPRTDLAPDPLLPADTRLWAVLQNASGGTWGGCVFDVEAIAEKLLGR